MLRTVEEESPEGVVGTGPEAKRHPTALWVDIQGPRDFLYRVFINRTFRKLVPGIIIFVTVLLLPNPDGLTIGGQRTIALFVLIVYLWVTETFPLPVTAFMAGIGLLILGVYKGPGEATDAFRMYAADAVFMVLGSLILAQGLVSSGGDRLLASGLLRHFVKSTNTLLFGIILLTALVSAVVPGHSVAAFMLPVVYSTMMATDMKKHPNEITAMIIGIAMGCAVGSLATPSGGARNAIAIGYLNDYYGRQIGYFEWVALALPLTLILIPVTFYVIKLVFKVKGRELSLSLAETKDVGLRPYLGLSILLTTVVLFLTVSDILSLGAVAMIGGVLMFVFGLLSWESARGDLRWGVIFIYGAALTMGEALMHTGAADWIANSVLGGLGGVSLFTIVTIAIFVTALFTNLVSDAAAVALILPIMLPIAFLAGGGEIIDGVPTEEGIAEAFLISMSTAIASAFAYITVFGTPPNTIVYASGRVRSKDFVKAGLPLWVISLLIMLVMVNTYWKLIL